jgi:hypothetical protein
MGPAGLTDSGGSCTGRVQGQTPLPGAIACALHIIHTLYDPELELISSIADVNARQAP